MDDRRCLSSADELGQAIRQLGCHSVFLVADCQAYASSGAETALAPLLQSARVTLFQDFKPNPRLADVLQGVRRYRESPAELILAVGGGTAIDTGKLIAALAPHADLPEMELDRLARLLLTGDQPLSLQPPPLIAVPTTAGTGSEATQFAVVYVDGVKYSLDAPELLPRYCLLDPHLTLSMPPVVTAHTGLDALSQAIESIWSVRATAPSTAAALAAAQGVLAHLPAAVSRPDLACRGEMQRAAHLAGRAINVTRTTAPHAISYALTSDHGIPHGHAVALTLGPMLAFNAEVTAANVNDPRGVEHVQQAIGQVLELLGCSDARQGCRRLQEFIHSVGCHSRLGPLGVSGNQTLAGIAAKVNPQRLGNNPRRMTSEDIIAILQSIA